jgi:hypothetical protein
VDGRACLVDGCACLVDGRACLVDGCAHLVDGCACLVDAHAHLADGRSYQLVACAHSRDKHAHPLDECGHAAHPCGRDWVWPCPSVRWPHTSRLTSVPISEIRAAIPHIRAHIPQHSWSGHADACTCPKEGLTHSPDGCMHCADARVHDGGRLRASRDRTTRVAESSDPHAQ